MTTQTVTPMYVNMPKAGKSYGSIKFANGNKMVGKAEVLGLMEKGKTYTVETETQRWGDGEVAVITKCTLANGSAPASQQQAEQYKRQPTPEIDAERMFVAGAINALLPEVYRIEHAEGRALGSDKIRAMVQIMRVVWSDTFGKDKEPLK